jgi:DNA (cytosine-5)-methyltransferase 1
MSGAVYYNDIEPFRCNVLRMNVASGLLPEGLIDERDIRDVHAVNLVGYTHVHLFAGIGAFPLGLEWAGVSKDIRIVTGGFPCQDLSSAGKRVGLAGVRSGLWFEMYRIVREFIDCDLAPNYILVENVSNLFRRGFGRILGCLADIGYDAEWQELQASDFGLPHGRKRLFLIAYPHEVGRGRVLRRFTGISLETKTRSQKTSNPLDTPRADLEAFEQRICEPALLRSYDGVPNGLDRLESLGDAIVPQIPQYIGRCIVASESINQPTK